MLQEVCRNDFKRLIRQRKILKALTIEFIFCWKYCLIILLVFKNIDLFPRQPIKCTIHTTKQRDKHNSLLTKSFSLFYSSLKIARKRDVRTTTFMNVVQEDISLGAYAINECKHVAIKCQNGILNSCTAILWKGRDSSQQMLL